MAVRTSYNNAPYDMMFFYLAFAGRCPCYFVRCFVLDCCISIPYHLAHRVCRRYVWNGHGNAGVVITLNEFWALCGIDTPVTDIPVHLHRRQHKISINIEVRCVISVDVGVTIYNVSSEFGLPNRNHQASVNLRLESTTHWSILCMNTVPGRRPLSTVNESWRPELQNKIAGRLQKNHYEQFPWYLE